MFGVVSPVRVFAKLILSQQQIFVCYRVFSLDQLRCDPAQLPFWRRFRTVPRRPGGSRGFRPILEGSGVASMLGSIGFCCSIQVDFSMVSGTGTSYVPQGPAAEVRSGSRRSGGYWCSTASRLFHSFQTLACSLRSASGAWRPFKSTLLGILAMTRAYRTGSPEACGDLSLLSIPGATNHRITMTVPRRSAELDHFVCHA